MTEQPVRLAVKLASRIERRRFLRHSAQAAFIGVAGLAAGGGLQLLHTPKSYANTCGKPGNKPGLSCPNKGTFGDAPCGPSPCCSYYGSGACNCESSPGSCKSNATCAGKGHEVYSTACWSCGVHVAGSEFITTCCDCHYTAAGGPKCNPHKGPYYNNRCISWYITETPA